MNGDDVQQRAQDPEKAMDVQDAAQAGAHATQAAAMTGMAAAVAAGAAGLVIGMLVGAPFPRSSTRSWNPPRHARAGSAPRVSAPVDAGRNAARG